MLRISWAQRNTNIWVRSQIEVKEVEDLLCFSKRRKLAKYSHWKRRPESLVLSSMEGEQPGKHCR